MVEPRFCGNEELHVNRYESGILLVVFTDCNLYMYVCINIYIHSLSSDISASAGDQKQ